MRSLSIVFAVAAVLAVTSCSHESSDDASPAATASTAAPSAAPAKSGTAAVTPSAPVAAESARPDVQPATPASLQDALSAVGPAAAVVTAARPGLDWDDLAGAVGKYPRDVKLLDGGVIGAQISQLVGTWLPKLKQNLGVSGPVQKAGDVYYVTGNAPHQGGSEQAYVMLDAKHKAVEVGLWQNGSRSVYTTRGANIAKPADINVMIANAKDGRATAARRGAPPKPMH